MLRKCHATTYTVLADIDIRFGQVHVSCVPKREFSFQQEG